MKCEPCAHFEDQKKSTGVSNSPGNAVRGKTGFRPLPRWALEAPEMRSTGGGGGRVGSQAEKSIRRETATRAAAVALVGAQLRKTPAIERHRRP